MGRTMEPKDVHIQSAKSMNMSTFPHLCARGCPHPSGDRLPFKRYCPQQITFTFRAESNTMIQ
jgi:hypothetical protein